jgi:hypothetical protein
MKRFSLRIPENIYKQLIEQQKNLPHLSLNSLIIEDIRKQLGVRADGLTDRRYLELVNSTRKGKEVKS